MTAIACQLEAEFDVAIKGDRIEWHAPGCEAASRKAMTVTRRRMLAADFATYRRECETETAELGEAGTIFHRCLGNIPLR